MALKLLIDREARAQVCHAVAHARFDLAVALIAVARHAIYHFGDQRADLPEFLLAEAARGAGGRAQPDARR